MRVQAAEMARNAKAKINFDKIQKKTKKNLNDFKLDTLIELKGLDNTVDLELRDKITDNYADSKNFSARIK